MKIVSGIADQFNDVFFSPQKTICHAVIWGLGPSDTEIYEYELNSVIMTWHKEVVVIVVVLYYSSTSRSILYVVVVEASVFAF